MDDNSRLQYLEALGVDVWLPRAARYCDQEVAIAERTETSVDAGKATAEAVATFSPANHENSWQQLQREVEGCQRCSLCESRTRTVFGCGDKNADWMLIGEAPGYSEDQEGKPFVGKAGQLLTEMLRAMGLQREQVFIANILKCRPPDNRDPKADEAEACADYLQQQIKLVRPKIILAVGRIAAQHLLNTEAPLAKLRGRVHQVHNIPVIVIYHPAYLLRALHEKRKAWEDLQMAMQVARGESESRRDATTTR